MEKSTIDKKIGPEKKILLDLVQKMRVEEFIINLVSEHVESHLNLPESESIKFLFNYQEVYNDNFMIELRELFIKKLDLLFDVIKEDIINNFVNH